MRTAVVRQTGVACLSQIELMPDRQAGLVYQSNSCQSDRWAKSIRIETLSDRQRDRQKSQVNRQTDTRAIS